MYKKFFICLFVLIIFNMKTAVVNSSSDLRNYRETLLEEFRDGVKFYSDGMSAESKHFKMRIDEEALEGLNITQMELENFFMGVLFIFEEAYQLVGEDFDYHPSGKRDVSIVSRKKFSYQIGRSEECILRISYTGYEMFFTPSQIKSIFGDFQDGVELIYRAYVRIIMYGIKGDEFQSKTFHELAKFEQNKALFYSRWLNKISGDEQESLIRDFNQQNEGFYEEYNDYVKNDVLAKRVILCEWCKTKIYLSKEKEDRRVRCINCKNLITIEE